MVFFGAYFSLNSKYETYFGSKPDFLHNLIIASMSDMCHVPISAPLEKISTQCINQSKPPGEVIRTLYKGVGSTKKGIWAFLPNPKLYLFLSLSPALTNTIFTQVKNYFLKARNKPNGVLGAGESFFVGAIARAIATLVIFPFIRAKIVMQSSGNQPIRKCIKDMYENGGFKALYTGLNAELIRGVVSSAITLMLKERSARMNRALVLYIFTLFGGRLPKKSAVPV